jgi:putative tryptophan/tyrosine transport system substrate-binding protein
MRRREFITLLGGTAALPLAARAQQQPALPTPEPLSKRPLIGFLGTSAKTVGGRYFEGFAQGLSDIGYVAGRNYVFEDRYANSDLARLPTLAEELVRLKPDVLVVTPTVAALAAKEATQSIPIVAVVITDPVGLGLVVSEAHPGTNVTGILARVAGLPGKQVEIALDIIPGAAKIGALVNDIDPSGLIQRHELEAAAAKIGVTLVPIDIRDSQDIGPAFPIFVKQGASRVIVLGTAMLLAMRRQIAAFGLATRMPTVGAFREQVEDGGLISYGTNLRESYRRAAYFVDRILKGTKPADLPVEFPTKVELMINLATAKALGVEVPPTLLARADEVIE